MREVLICVPCFCVLTVRNFQGVLLFLLALFSNFCFSASTRWKTSTINSKFKKKCVQTTFVVKTFDVVLWNAVLVVRKLKEKERYVFFPDTQTHRHLLLTSFLRQSFNSSFFLIEEAISTENCRFCSLHWKSDCPVFQIRVFILTHLDFRTPNS